MRGLVASALVAASLSACAPAAPAADSRPVLDTSTWSEAVEPLRVAGSIHYVGTRGLGVYLITTPAGHILLDGGMPGSGPIIEASIRKLGFKPEDLRVLLITHAHFDHVGTLAHFKRLSGARVEVMEGDVPLLVSGGRTDYLYAGDERFHFEPVTADRALHDGDVVEVGGITLTARLTAGHTPGCTTWSTTIQEDGRPLRVVFPGSTSINPGTKLVKEPSYRGIADDYRRALAVLDSLQPDVWLAAHPSFFDFDGKRARAASEGTRAFVDPDGYRRRIASQRETLEGFIAKETGR